MEIFTFLLLEQSTPLQQPGAAAQCSTNGCQPRQCNDQLLLLHKAFFIF